MKLTIIIILIFVFFQSNGQSEKVILDLLPILIDNTYNIDYPTADSSFKAENTPKCLKDSLYYFSTNEWDYLTKRGYVIYDSLPKLRPEQILDLKEKIFFKNEKIDLLFQDYLQQCDSSQGLDIEKIVDNKKYYSFDNYLKKYGSSTQNGFIFFSPIVFSQDNKFACFYYTAAWQGHDFERLIIASSLLDKWRIFEMRNINDY